MPLDLAYGTRDATSSRRNAFDEDASVYDRVRPRYCPALFAAILNALPHPHGTHALEIGPGTGQATSPFLDAGCSVLAVELGSNLAAFLAEKHHSNPNLTVVNGDFLDIPETQTFDLIYSATAFHWIPREEGMAKVLRMLRPGGLAALFWNHPIVGIDPESHAAGVVQEVYRTIGRSGKGKVFDGSTCPAYVQRLEDAGFTNVRYSLYRSERILTGAEYVQLMQSYSDHRTLPDEKRMQLEVRMEEAIRSELHNALPILDIMDLYLAEKSV